MKELLRVFRREAGAYFSSPVAYLFIGTFLAVTLFVFFWAEAFFARNIADVRPLFEWMPILLIALVAALTMRAWSEERRAGTVEVLMTAPVSSLKLVGGKFLAALSLIAVAMLLTLPLPITVDFLGPLDWGPVIGGYVATLFLGAAYVSMGLFVSSRTDNQIVSLIVTALLGTAFYLIGSDTLTTLAPEGVAQLMRLIGTGSRFDEITRGVLDLRDIYYYVSLVGLFLALNVYSLEKLRWGGDRFGARHHAAWRTAVALVAVNFLVANLWLQPVASARADITANNRYTLSEATDLYLASLNEPLILRGYFSHKTHPLLSPLVPQMRDLLHEYAVQGGNNVRVQFVDPQSNPQAAKKARQQYGIQPVPLQTANRYESSVVNAYFHVLVKYGDQHKVLDLQDLIDIKGAAAGSQIKVGLNNPEYQITSAIREVVSRWRSGGNVFAELKKPVTFHGYISAPSKLPDALKKTRKNLQGVLDDMQKKADGKLKVDFADPEAGNGKLADRLQSEYGFQPMTTSLLGGNRFYFYMVLQQGDRTVPVSLPDSLKKPDLRKALQDGLKRFGGGFRKTVAVYQPPQPRSRFRGRGGPSYRTLMQKLRENAVVSRTSLKDGQVPQGTDLLLVLSPRKLDEKQRFAIDQFLMRGGSVVIAGSPMHVQVSRRTGVNAKETDTGLASWLGHYGIKVGKSLVLDTHSGALTLPVRGPGGGIQMQTIDYPLFIDVRGKGMADVPMLGDLGQVTMAWTSPISIDRKKAGDLKVTTLLQSSPESWTSDSKQLIPDYQKYPDLGFPAPTARGRHPLGVMLKGRFKSAFAGQQSPLQRQAAEGQGKPDKDGSTKQGDKGKGKDKEQPTFTSVIEHSPDSARLVVFGSGNFLSDSALQIVGRSTQSEYVHPVQLAQNVIDWSLEDPALLSLRGRSHYSRLLRPISDDGRTAWEGANYASALGGLAIIFALQRLVALRRRRRYERILNEEEA